MLSFIAIDHGPPVSSGPGWNDPTQAILALAKKKEKQASGALGASTNTVNAITSPITQPLAMGPGMADPNQPPPPMGLGSNPATASQPPPPPMNYGYQQPQQSYYGVEGSSAPPPNLMGMGSNPAQGFEAPPPPASIGGMHPFCDKVNAFTPLDTPAPASAGSSRAWR